MHRLQKNYSLHVVIATVFASAMILITANGVADAVKETEEASLKSLQKHPLPPPGPFELINSQGKKTVTGGQQPQKAVAPTAPNMPDMMQVTPKLGIAPPIALKPASLEPANKGIKKNVIINEPVFQKTMPSMSQALQTIKKPVNNPQPVVPVMPSNKMVPPTVNAPIPRTMPQLKHNMHPQQAMPQFRGNPRQLRIAPQIQQYRYIPLPVYQANFSYLQPPSFNGSAPGYWVPQTNNK